MSDAEFGIAILRAVLGLILMLVSAGVANYPELSGEKLTLRGGAISIALFIAGILVAGVNGILMMIFLLFVAFCFWILICAIGCEPPPRRRKHPELMWWYTGKRRKH